MLSGLIGVGGFGGGSTPTPSPLVPLSSTAAYVNKGGNDGTGTVGDRALPFLTVQAAVTAIPFLGIVYVEDGTYVENITGASLKTIHLRNAFLDGDIDGNISVLSGDVMSDVFSESTSSPFGFSRWRGTMRGTFCSVSGVNVVQGDFEGNTPGTTPSIYLRNIDTLEPATGTLVGPASPGIGQAIMYDIKRVFSSGVTLLGGVPFSPGAGKRHHFKRIGQLKCDGFMSTYDEWTTVYMEDVNMVCGGDIFSGAIGNTTFPMTLSYAKYCDLETTGGGAFMNFTGVGGVGQFLFDTYHSTYKIDAVENINRPAGAAGTVVLKTANNTRKLWDTSGVVNQFVVNDFVDANI